MAARLANLQEAVRRAERLRLLGQVSGGLAHQARNGLTGARLALQQFARELPENTDLAALDVALRQLTLLETNIKRFLDLGREEQRHELCDLAALTDESIVLVRPQCEHAAIALSWRRPSAPSFVNGDPSQLGQVVVNLLTNAIEAAGPGGRVEVLVHSSECHESVNGFHKYSNRVPTDAEASSSSDSASNRSIYFEVRDSGAGPPARLAERVFEPFVTGKPEGVGLGLAVARQVVEAHGGAIGWTRADQCTSFRFHLPACSELSTGARPPGATLT
jgi:signal transduction histidine kinase